jgi:hypothetical protein
MFIKIIKFALAVSFICGGAISSQNITLEQKDIVTGKVCKINQDDDSDKLNDFGQDIAEGKGTLITFEDAKKQPGYYMCLVEKEGKFYIIKFQVKEAEGLLARFTPNKIEQIDGEIEFIMDKFDASDIIGGCYKGDIMDAARIAIEYNLDSLVPVSEVVEPGHYIGLIRKPDKLYLREFRLRGDKFIKVSQDAEFIKQPDSEPNFIFMPSEIIRGCHATGPATVFNPASQKFEQAKGDGIEGAKYYIREDKNLKPFEKIEYKVDHFCAIKDNVGNFYLVQFTKAAGTFYQTGIKFPLDWKFLVKISDMKEKALDTLKDKYLVRLDPITNDLETAINQYIVAVASGTDKKEN